MIGMITGYIAFLLSLGATVTFFLSYTAKKEGAGQKLAQIGSYMYYFVTLGVFFMSVFLLSLIMDHNFAYTYVHNYSSRELPTLLLISSFYAGQEGSFLLWALFFVIIGLFIKPYSKKYGYESLVMGLFSLIMTFLLLLIILKSPFERLWETYKDHPQAMAGIVPENGRGMNPILQNYWMAIHPPILFIGYAMMAVPFVFAIAGLIKRDFNNWIKVVMPWTLMATAVLGLGIMLGGFWAYETLGWGGFWGWDPVENSSLLPWLIAIALVHTFLVQEKTGGLIKTNFVLSILTFLFILYATFLTRSGVLSDTSVHSFTKPGNLVYAILLAFQGVFLILGFVVFFIRSREISSEKHNMNFVSKESFLTIGSLAVLASALLVFVGTSFPIFTALLGTKAEAIQIQFYNDSNLPVAIIILLTNALAIYMNWKTSSWANVLKKSLIAIIISAAGTVISLFLGVKGVGIILLVFASFFTLVVNLELTIRLILKNPRYLGAYISHLGLAVFIFGVIGSGVFSETQNMHLKKGESRDFKGYKISFVGDERIEKELKDREKYNYLVSIEKDGKKEIVKPVIYLSDFNERSQPFLEPGIKSYLFKDIYVSPKSVENEINGPVLKLAKHEKGESPLDKNLQVEFTGFDMMHSQSQDGSMVKFGATVKFTFNGQEKEDTLVAMVDMSTGEFIPIMTRHEASGQYVGFAQFIQDPNEISLSKVLLVFSSEAKAPDMKKDEVFTFEVSSKPLINLVWFGVILIVAGFAIAIFKRKNSGAQITINDNKDEAAESGDTSENKV